MTAEFDVNMEWADELTWDGLSDLVRYILVVLLVVVGLNSLLHSPLRTQFLMAQYRDRGVRVPGDVLSCDKKTAGLLSSSYELSILYTAPIHKYADDPRMRFRYPDAVTYKRFLRRFDIYELIPRGSVVKVLVMKGRPRSGMAAMVVERILAERMCVRAALIALPGVGLLILTIWIAISKARIMDDPLVGYVVLAVSVLLILTVCHCCFDRRFEAERQRRFDSAVSMAVKSTMPGERPTPGGRAEPLLPLSSLHGVPVVQGVHVV